VVLKDSAGVTIWGPERLADSAGNFAADLADSSSASLGDALVAVKRTATGAIATTQHAWNETQPLSAFDFMTSAQIADYQSGAKTLDLATPLQAWITACDASNLIGILPPGGGRVGTTLTVPTGVVLRGHGIQSQLSGWGVNVFQVTGDHCEISSMALFGYTNGGSADPRTEDAITSAGTLGTKVNFLRIKQLYLQGWNRCIDLQYVDNSVIDDSYTVNSNYGVRLYGQCVNNVITNSRLICNSGISSIHTVKNGADQSEGLMVSNCLLASGQNAFLSNGFLAVGFDNCVVDLLTEYAFDMSGVMSFSFNGPWVYSAKRCFNFQALGSPTDIDATISVGLATTTGAAQNLCVVGANNKGITIAGGTYNLSNASGGLPFVLSGDNIVVGPIVCRNATSNSDIQVNGTNIRLSQEIYAPKGIQTIVSQIRSVASAATTTLPYPTGAAWEHITITGNTGCTNLNDPAAWPGKMVTLLFTGTPTWTDGGNLKMAGNLVATADDTLTLTSNGTNWYEVCRSVN
jgi:hypothetical protein